MITKIDSERQSRCKLSYPILDPYSKACSCKSHCTGLQKKTAGSYSDSFLLLLGQLELAWSEAAISLIQLLIPEQPRRKLEEQNQAVTAALLRG